jgi:hypothetical protein
MSNSNLPLWLQHHDGLTPAPTPEQVESDYQRELKAAQDAIDGKPDSKETKAMHAALMDYYGGMTLDDSPRQSWMETLPKRLPFLADFAQRPFSEILTLIVLATSGGALVAGILIPIAYEMAQGKFAALPYGMWGISLWLACAAWLKGKKWLPFLWFTGIIFIISSWV